MLPSISNSDSNDCKNDLQCPLIPQIILRETKPIEDKTSDKEDTEITQKTEVQRIKSQTCKVCNKTLASIASYYVHMKQHSESKPYHCSSCDASFSRKPYLAVHLRTHTGEKPFQCDSCEKKFTQKSSLNTHKRVHTGDKPYECQICQKCFSVKSYLTAHHWTHFTGFPLFCNECKVTFPSKTKFAEHMKTHSSRNFDCEICGKYFVKDTSLIRHQNKVHGRIKAPEFCNTTNTTE